LMAFEQFLSSLPFNMAQRVEEPTPKARPAPAPAPRRENLISPSASEAGDNGHELQLVIPSRRKEEPRVGRNEPCPCGSGKKYKNCHGRTA
jgi:uncharacterized protein YecA (UPF0149 family)